MEEGLIVDVDPTSIEIKGGGSAGAGPGAGGGGGKAAGGSSGALARRLWAAALRGDAPAVGDLMALGAPFTTDWVGAGPLHCAAHGGSAAATRALLRAGAHTHARTKVERTALHIAAWHGHADTADVLLQHDADPHARDLVGMTALHWACARGHARLVQTLLQYGADPSVEDRLRATPRDLARDPGIVRMLDQHRETRESNVTREPSLQPPPSPDPSNTLESSEVLLKKLKQVHRGMHNKKFKTNVTTPLSEVSAGALRRLRALGSAPGDDEHALLSAVRRGRTLLLSDAGKLLLKESSLDPKMLANNQRIPTTSQLPTGNDTPSANTVSSSAAPGSGGVSVAVSGGVSGAASGGVSGGASGAMSGAVSGGVSAPMGRRVVRMVNVRARPNDQLDSFTLKKIITPEDNQVRYVAVPRKCVVIQKVPKQATTSLTNVESQVTDEDASEIAAETLVQTQEDTNEESEVMRLRQQVTSLRKRLARYEQISDEDE